MDDRGEGAFWTVDAEASLQAVLDDPGCPGLLSRVLTTVRSWQVRNETTVGRTLRASRLMPQWTAALVTLGARVAVEGQEQDVDVITMVRERIAGEVIALRVPQHGDRCWGEAHVARTPSDDPIVAALAAIRSNSSDGTVEEARVTLTGVSSHPVWTVDAVEELLGQALDEGRIRDVASAVGDEVEPQGDYLGSETYRRAMAEVLTRRALEACAASLTAGGGR
jgi:CO/xanthine dehydrogenase FAD-binding subunit